MAIPLEPPWANDDVTLEYRWSRGAELGAMILGADYLGATIDTSMEASWPQGFVLGSSALGADRLGAEGWGALLEPPW